jgi:hypothetical protein
MSSVAYFAADGNFGDAEGLVVVDTSKWREQEWAEINRADDRSRGQVARELAAWVARG